MVPAGGSGGWRSSQRYEMRFMKLTPENIVDVLVPNVFSF